MSKFLVFALLLATVTGYNYKDEVYNQLIRAELDHLEPVLHDHPVNYRVKRDEEASVAPATDKCNKKRKFRMCCGEDIVEAMLEKDRELKKECYRKVVSSGKEEKPLTPYDPFNCEKVNRTKKEWSCVMECVGQKKKLIDSNGDILEKPLLDHYREALGAEEWFFAMIEDAFPKCLAQVLATTNFTRSEEDPLSCNPAGVKMHHCMWRELQMRCPTEKISDMKTCQKIRDRYKKQDGHEGRGEEPLGDDPGSEV